MKATPGARLLRGLRSRAPDDRVGVSLLVFRLTQDEIDSMLRPDP